MKPFLVTMGDAVGIGPEIIVRAFERGALAQAIVVGDPAVLRRAGAPMTAVVEHPADLPTVPPAACRCWRRPACLTGWRHCPGVASTPAVARQRRAASNMP